MLIALRGKHKFATSELLQGLHGRQGNLNHQARSRTAESFRVIASAIQKIGGIIMAWRLRTYFVPYREMFGLRLFPNFLLFEANHFEQLFFVVLKGVRPDRPNISLNISVKYIAKYIAQYIGPNISVQDCLLRCNK